ncbi:MAG: helix-turn-helix transcriptional regulator [Oscillospiraceae bacterium]|nr:helix-turn-helix transcriptional regulator [Oscillospiraceae bacterium]
MTEREFYYFNSRLTGRLNCIRKKPLTIVRAPMISGKTTAVRSYVDNLKCRYSWNCCSAETFRDWFGNFLSQIGGEIPEIQAEKPDFTTSLSAAASCIANMLKRSDKGAMLIYVLDCSGKIDENIAIFLYQLAAQRIEGFHIVIMSRFHLFTNTQMVLQDYINYISDDYFMLTPEEIIQGYGSYGIRLLPEEAALIYRFTSGWMPAITRIYQQITHLGKARTLMGLEELFASWIMLASNPEDLGLTPVQWELLSRMSVYESFSADELCNYCQQVGGDFPSAAFSLLNTQNLPAFLYYDENSGRYHMHYLLVSALSARYRLFTSDQKAENDRVGDGLELQRLQKDGAQGSRQEVRDQDLYELLQMILQFAPKESLTMLQAIEFTIADTGRNRCTIQIFRAAINIFSGNTDAGMSMLRESLNEQLRSGGWHAASELSRAILLLRLLRGGDWDADVEDLCIYMLKTHRNKGQKPKSLLFQGLLLLRLHNYQNLIALFEQQEPFAEPCVECIRTLLLAIAYESLEQPEMALKFLEDSLKCAIAPNLILPYLWYYSSIFHGLEQLKKNPEYAPFCARIRSSLTVYRRLLSKQSSDSLVHDTTLTARQLEIVALVSERLTNKEIATRLNVSENTIKTTVQTIFKKMNIQKRSELYR